MILARYSNMFRLHVFDYAGNGVRSSQDIEFLKGCSFQIACQFIIPCTYASPTNRYRAPSLRRANGTSPPPKTHIASPARIDRGPRPMVLLMAVKNFRYGVVYAIDA